MSERPECPKDLNVRGVERPGTWMSERPECPGTWMSGDLDVRDLSVQDLNVQDLNVRQPFRLDLRFWMTRGHLTFYQLKIANNLKVGIELIYEISWRPSISPEAPDTLQVSGPELREGREGLSNFSQGCIYNIFWQG